jgi:hypothetical protein
VQKGGPIVNEQIEASATRGLQSANELNRFNRSAREDRDVTVMPDDRIPRADLNRETTDPQSHLPLAVAPIGG